MENDLATTKEVAEYLRTTVQRLAHDRYENRGLPYIKHGRTVLYRWSDVHAYINARTTVPADRTGAA